MDFDSRGRREIPHSVGGAGTLDAAGEPFDLLRRDLVFLPQDPPEPERQGGVVFGNADPLPPKVPGLPDPRRFMNIDVRVPERAGEENRDGHEPAGAFAAFHDVVGKRHLRDVEFLVLQHPAEDFVRLPHDAVQRNPFRMHGTVPQRPCAVIVAAGQSQPDVIRHTLPPSGRRARVRGESITAFRNPRSLPLPRSRPEPARSPRPPCWGDGAPKRIGSGAPGICPSC